MERLKREALDLSRYSVHVAIILSLVFSLTAIAILSKQHLTHQRWAIVAAITVPLPVALYFRSRIVLLGGFAYGAFLIGALAAAVLLGI